jgi:thioesterase domain-containing protein
MFEAQSLDLLALKMDTHHNPVWQPMVAIQTGGEHKLFCVHPLGGEVLCYRDLARSLGDEFSVYALQASGLVNGQAIQDDLSRVIKCYVDEILKIQPSGPYFLCGQSLGGVLAIAVAEALHKQGAEIAFVALFDSFVPNSKNLQMLGIEHLRAAIGSFMQLDETALHNLSELDQLQVLFEQAKANYLIPQDIDFSQVKNRYLVARANIHLAESMHMKTIPFAIRHFEAAQSLSGLHSHQDWGAFASDISYYKVTGHHESIMHLPNVTAIASILKTSIENQ